MAEQTSALGPETSGDGPSPPPNPYLPNPKAFRSNANGQGPWSYQDDDPSLAGVGLYFTHEDDVTRVVKVVRGGAAARDGRIRKRDRLITVNGTDVSKASLQTLRGLLLGVAGSFVELGLKRTQESGEVLDLQVKLQRGSKEYLDNDQMAPLRAQLEAAQAKIVSLRRAMNAKDVECGDHSTALEVARNSLSKADRETQTLKAELAEERHKRQVAEEAAQAMTNDVSRERSETGNIRKAYTDSVSQLKRAESVIADLTDKLKLSEEVAASEARRREEAEAREASSREETGKQHASRRQLDSTVAGLQLQLAELQERVRVGDASLAAEVRYRSDSERREREAQEKSVESRAAVRELEGEVRTLKARLVADAEAMGSVRDELDKVLNDVRAREDALQNEKAVVVQLEERIERMAERHKAELERLTSTSEEMGGGLQRLANEASAREGATRVTLQALESDYALLQSNEKALNDRCCKQETELTNLRNRVSDLQQTLETVRSAPPPKNEVAEGNLRAAIAARERDASALAELHAEFSVAKEELNTLRLSNGELRGQEAQTRALLDTEEGQNRQLSNDLSRTKISLEQSNEQLSQVKHQLEQERSSAAELKEALDDAERRADQLELLTEAVDALRGQCDAAEGQVVTLRNKLRAADAAASDATANVDGLKEELSRANSRNESLSGDLERCKVELTQSANDLTKTRRDLKTGNDAHAKEHREKVACSALVDELRADNEKLFTDLTLANANSQREASRAEVERKLKQEALDSEAEMRKTLSQALAPEASAQLRADLQQARSALANAEGARERAEAALDSESWARKSLEETRSNLEEELQRLRTQSTQQGGELASLRAMRSAKATADEELQVLENKLKSTLADVAALRIEVEGERQRADTEQKIKEEASHREHTVRKTLEEERDRAVDLHRRLAELQGALDQSKSRQDTLQVERDRAMAEAEERARAKKPAPAPANNAANSEALSTLQKQLETAKSNTARARDEASEARSAAERFKAQAENLSSQLRAMTNDRDSAVSRLNDLNRLPSPCGVGMELESGGGPHSSDVFVKMVVPGMSAAMSDAIRIGDILVSIDGRSVAGLLPADIRPLVLGPRASPIQLSFLRSGEPFDVTLKRGAFGPEHCIVSPEELDMAEGSSTANLISRHNRGEGQGGPRPASTRPESAASTFEF